MNIVVLGAGRIGSAIVRDLSAEEGFSVTVVDLDPAAIAGLNGLGVRAALADLSDPDMVAKDIPTADADQRLVDLIKQYGRWVDPPVGVGTMPA